MQINDSLLQNGEKITFALRELYRAAGYAPYRMSKFEEYDLYAGNKDFLLSDNVITFTDTDGKLMALKPDVTLSIIKNSPDEPDVTRKVCYNENVYRVSKGTGAFREITQTGVECFGRVDLPEIVGVVSLAAQSMRTLDPGALLLLSDLDAVSAAVSGVTEDGETQKRLFAAVGDKNRAEIESICAACPDRAAAARLLRLSDVTGPAADCLPALEDLLGGDAPLCATLRALSDTPCAPMLYVDLSVTGDLHYYNGIVFKGFLPDVPTDVLSGGQYDRLMRRLGRRSCAIGFAVDTDVLDRVDLSAPRDAQDDGFVNIALPKGRLGEQVYDLFARAGYECPSLLEPNRKLIFENPGKKVRYFWVKPSDVPIYVERGAADIGVAGKDILLEYEPEVYELLDLKKGRCRMAVAAPKGYREEPEGTLRVATKFAKIARAYYRARGRDIDIIHLNGSIEIAPILGLSDVIVDIVETGTTLKENDLEVVDTVLPISARLIANRAAYPFKRDRIRAITENLYTITENDP